MEEKDYGKKIKDLRVKMGLTQADVAKALDVTPGYICNVENGRTAMSLRVLIYYARLMNTTLDSLVGDLEPEYKAVSMDNRMTQILASLTDDEKEKLIRTINIWKELS